MIARAAVAILLAIVFVPVAVTQVLPSEGRRFTWVELHETTSEEIRFANVEQDLELAGMLFVPPGEGPFPAAVVIHGSGTSSRQNGWYLTVVKHLQDHGVAVLLPDKRGSEESEGDWRIASLEDLATDTVAAVSFLTRQTDVPIGSIGLVGMSQGGRIAPIAAGMAPEIDYVVNVVGGTVPAHESLRYEETNNLREIGFLPGIADILAYPSTFLLINVSKADFWSAIGDFDPLPYWEVLSVPALVLYGELDTNVPTEASARRLRALGRPDITVNVYAGSGHAIEDPPDQGDRIFRADALADIVTFIRGQAEAPSQET